MLRQCSGLSIAGSTVEARWAPPPVESRNSREIARRGRTARITAKYTIAATAGRATAPFLLRREAMQWTPGDRSDIDDERGRSGIGGSGIGGIHLGIGGFLV